MEYLNLFRQYVLLRPDVIFFFFIQEQQAYLGIYTYEPHLEPEITFQIRLPVNMLLLYHILFDWS